MLNGKHDRSSSLSKFSAAWISSEWCSLDRCDLDFPPDSHPSHFILWPLLNFFPFKMFLEVGETQTPITQMNNLSHQQYRGQHRWMGSEWNWNLLHRLNRAGGSVLLSDVSAQGCAGLNDRESEEGRMWSQCERWPSGCCFMLNNTTDDMRINNGSFQKEGDLYSHICFDFSWEEKKSDWLKTSEVRGGFFLRLNFSLLVRTTTQKMFNGATEDFSHH